MPVSFEVEIADFPPGAPWAPAIQVDPPAFTWASIVRAAILAGYPDLHHIPSPQFARWRTAALHMALRRAHGHLIRPPEWEHLDPSEKGTVRSLLGVAVTKLLVERFLKAPLFFFLDVHFVLNFPPDVERLRPDFVAMTADGEWFSVEAKGRERFRAATQEKGKRQASALGSVNGQAVQAGVVCVTFFSGERLKAVFAGPPPNDKNSADAEGSVMEAARDYYARLLRFRQFSQPVEKISVPITAATVPLWRSPELDVTFGLDPRIETALNQRSPERLQSVLQEFQQADSELRHSNLGPDGIIVIPGETWREDSLGL